MRDPCGPTPLDPKKVKNFNITSHNYSDLLSCEHKGYAPQLLVSC